MQYVLEEYQERSVQTMMRNPFHYLAYEMGLGKTLIVLDYLRRTGQKALIVAPLLVAKRTWPQEVRKWDAFRDWKAVVLHGRDKDILVKSDAHLKIINVDGLRWLYRHVRDRGSNDLSSRVLVIDESTMIKSSPSGLSTRFLVLKAMQHFFKQGIFCLSGTPLSESHMGLWSQYWMLDRGKALGTSFSAFRKRFFFESGSPRWIVELREGAKEEIRKLVQPMTSVLLAKDHVKMPDVVQRDVVVDLPDPVRLLYNKLKKEFVWANGSQGWSVDSSGVLVSKLRQVAQGAIYPKDGGGEYEKLHEAKVDALQTLVEEANGDPIVCAINFRFELDMIRKRFGYEVPAIVGGMPLGAKEKILSDFSERKIPLLLCHPASMSHGVNDLQKASHIAVWFGLPWSLEHYSQLIGRLARRGQKRVVVVYHLVARNTVDSRVFKVLYDKNTTQEEFKRVLNRAAMEETS